MLTRREWLSGFSAGLLQTAKPPNVVLIMTDDQGWFDLGVNGNPHIETPVIDKLASEGVRFSHFYASPVCTPTRAALMTGRHYQRTGAVDTFLGRDVMNADEITLGQLMQRHGYRTGCVGKWHLGRYMKYHPNERGFDEYFGFWQYGFMNRYFDSDELFDNRKRVEVTGYITDNLTDRAMRFIRANSARPFFLYVPYNAPHAPYDVPDKYIARYLTKGLPLDQARIYGMVSCLDDGIGRILKTLDDQKLRDNTVVFFMTDNGGVSRHYKCGLRGNKGSVYEGGVRVPLIARWPGRFPAGKTVDAMGQHIDLLPTIAELTGASLPTGRALDGKSLASVMRNGAGESPHRHLFHQWNRGYPVLETVAGNPELKANWAVRSADGWKYLHNGELFNLHKDPGEQQDVAAEFPAKAAELRKLFEDFHRDVTKGKDYSRVPIQVGRADENPVEIDLTWGQPVGTRVKPTYRSYNRDTIENWSSADDSVRWNVEAVESGDYEVILTYGCDSEDAGARIRIQVGGASLEHTSEATAGRMVFRPLSAGTLKLAKGLARLEIKPLSIKCKEPMLLH